MRRLAALLCAVLLAASARAADPIGVSVNGVDVADGAGEGWTYAKPTLRLAGSGPFVLNGMNTTGTVRVVVSTDSIVVLSNLTLRTTESRTCSFQIAARAAVDVWLAEENKLTSGPYQAGLQVPVGATLRLNRLQSAPYGSLEAHGGSQGGPGIGGARSVATGRIFIEGGVVSAWGGDTAAGIGGGYRKAGGEIAISGGTVHAFAGEGGDDIGGGKDGAGGAVTITGGSVTIPDAGRIREAPTNAGSVAVHCVTVTGLVVNAAVTLKGLDGYGANDIESDDAGRLNLWLPNGAYVFQANGLRFGAQVEDGPTLAYPLEALRPAGVRVNGEDVGLAEAGDGWRFDLGVRRVTLTAAGPFVFSGTNLLERLEVRAESPARAKFLGFASDAVRLAGPLEIGGGTLAAEAATGPVTITGGSVACGAFSVAPSNGAARVWCVTVANLPPWRPVAVTGLEGYGVEGLVADADGCINLWLPNGDRVFAVNGVAVRACVADADTRAEPLPDVTLTGVRVNGIDAAYGQGIGWSYVDSVLRFSGAGPFVLSGTNAAGAVAVEVEADATLRLAGVSLTAATSAIAVGVGYSLALELDGENILEGGRTYPAVAVPEGAGLKVRAAATWGRLTARGGEFAAGIGGGIANPGGNIQIASGTVRAVAGTLATAIGKGFGAPSGADVTIRGGSVDAETIENSPVDAQGRAVFCVTVPNLEPGAVVRPSGLADYGVEGIVADDAGQVYLWLPNGTATFAAGGHRYTATVEGGAVTATDLGTAVPEPTVLKIAAFTVGNGVAELELATDLPSADFADWADNATFEVEFRENLADSDVQTLIPVRTGTRLSVTLPPAACGFLTVRAR